MSENCLTELKGLFLAHQGKVSDKWASYLPAYEDAFKSFRERPLRLLEIGVQNGGSLEVWSQYFANAEAIIGCDVNPECSNLVYDDARISLVIGDACEDSTAQFILGQSPAYDIVIDDGSHRSGDIIRCFAKYFPHVTEGGLYVVEDLHCSYWREYEGGLYHPLSSLSFLKRLVDVIGYEHWGIQRARGELMRAFGKKYAAEMDELTLSAVHSVTFQNSLCVIRKKSPESNLLGQRVVVGQGCDIVQAIDSALGVPDQRENAWSAVANPIEEEFELGRQEIMRLDEKIARLEADAVALNARIVLMEASHSWRLTKPLRLLARYIRKGCK